MVKHLIVFFQGLESLGKTFRYINCFIFPLRKFYRQPFTVGFRFRPKINNNIIYPSLCTTYKLGLGFWWQLHMHASQCPFFTIERYITLNNICLEIMCQKLVFTETSCKKSPLIYYFFKLNYIRSL